MFTKIQVYMDTLSNHHKHIYNIIIGIIGSAIFAILTWTVYFFYNNIYGIINFILGSSNFLLDKIYKSIAKGDGVLAQIDLILGFVVGIYFGILYLILVKLKGNHSVNAEGNGNTKNSSFLKVTGLRIMIIFGMIYLVTYLNISIYKGVVTTLFNQNLTIIVPYISEQESNLLKSRFAQMKSKNEFELIMQDIKKFGIQYNVNTVDIPKYPF